MMRNEGNGQSLGCFILLFLGSLLVVSSLGTNRTHAQPLQRVEIPSSPNPVGSGARALGMGNAFIGVADDATAASWNPGGLIQLERPEVSAVGAFFWRREDLDFGTNPEASGTEWASEQRVNYLSGSYPFTLFNRNMIVSLNYQNLIDFTRDWDFPLLLSSPGLSITQDVDFEQTGTLSAFGLAYAIQIIPSLSFGFTINYWGDGIYDNEWEAKTRQTGSGNFMGERFNFETAGKDRFSFEGWNANIGVLWYITSRLTLGAVFKTPFEADLERTSSFTSMIRFPDDPGADQTISTSDKEDEDLDWPAAYGIGAAYRFSDQFTMSFDVFRTEWDDFILEDSRGNKTSPISGKPKNESDVDPTYQVRLGAEYLFIREKYVIPVRAGAFYDGVPAEDDPDDFFGLTVGSGIAYKWFIFDFAYQYRFGNDVGESILENFDFSQDVDEHTLYTSLIIHL